MRPAGLAQVEAARADGRWDAAYDGQRIATVPPDLQAALDANPEPPPSSPRSEAQNRYADPLPRPGRQAPRDARETDRQIRRRCSREGETLH